MEQHTTSLLSWNTHEFEKKDRHPDWIWYAGLLFLIGAVLAFFYGSIFFGIFLVVAGGVVIIHALREPKFITVSFEEKGLSINEELIPYERIVGFWLDETAKPDKLLLRVKGSFIPLIILPVEYVSAEQVRNAFKDKVPETEIRMPNSIKIFDRAGF